MTVEEKAKAYDEALEKTRIYRDNARIAEDYVAVARYENIFPQLLESEDERIRKGLIEVVSDIAGGWPFEEHKITKNEALSYLKKQKEFFEHGYGLYYYHNGGFTYINSPAIEGEKQKEQKPTSFNEPYNPDDYEVVMEGNATSLKKKEKKPADDKAFEEWIDGWWKHNKVNNPDSYDKGDEIQFDEKGFKNFCRGVRNMYANQESAEWSEEDDWKRKELIQYLEEKGDYRTVWMTWLKSLQERFSLEPKQEWSEADEKHINNILDIIDCWKATTHFVSYQGGTIDADIKWLKSLRPQLHWKFSKEQMDALKNVAYGTYQNGNGPALRSLYEQLKKLGVKEEPEYYQHFDPDC